MSSSSKENHELHNTWVYLATEQGQHRIYFLPRYLSADLEFLENGMQDFRIPLDDLSVFSSYTVSKDNCKMAKNKFGLYIIISLKEERKNASTLKQRRKLSTNWHSNK